MNSHPLFGAFTAILLAGPAFGQLMPAANFAVNRMPSYTIGQPTAFQPQVGAINPYAYAPAIRSC